MTTYTIATVDDMLIACVLDGDSAALDAEIAKADLEPNTDVEIINGLELTNEWPEDESRLVYIGGNQGWLTDGPDASGEVYRYAVRAA